jgi:DNA polymerase III delta subunit
VPKKEFSEDAVPPFDHAPSVVAVVGEIPFFVEEAAERARGRLAGGDVEVLRFDDEAPPGSVAEALLNRSLFSPRRLVEVDLSRVLGADSPVDLLEKAVDAWTRGSPAGKREAFRHVRRVLSSLDVAVEGDPSAAAAAVTRKVRKKDLEEPLAEILRELPEEKGGEGATLVSALRLLLTRPNDGLVALVTAAAPPKGSDLLAEVARKGLVLEVRMGEKRPEIAGALQRLARARAKERDVAIEDAAITRLVARTDVDPGAFAAELDKLLDWAGEGGRIRAADVGDQIADEESEDVYAFFESVGKRDAADALARLDRLFSGRLVRAGNRIIDPNDGRWPQIFLAMLTDEIRRMLLVRSRLAERGAPVFNPEMSWPVYQARVAPFLEEPVAPFGKSPFGGRAAGYPFLKAAGRATRFNEKELARALARAADVDVKMKNSAPIVETLTAYVGDLIAGT